MDRAVRGLRDLATLRVASPQAGEYVELVRATGFEEPEQHSTHAVVVLRRELVAARRTGLALVSLLVVIGSGLVLGLGVVTLWDFPLAVGIVMIALGLAALAPGVVLGLHVLVDGRRVKRAHQAWTRANRRVLGKDPHIGTVGAHYLFSWRGGAHATLMGIFLVLAFGGFALPILAALSDSLPVSERVGFAVVTGIGGAAVVLATYALWHTPWSMFYQEHVF